MSKSDETTSKYLSNKSGIAVINTESDVLDASSDPVIKLAMVVSMAVQVDWAYLRRARICLLPELEANVEADLWASHLVTLRGPYGFVIDNEISHELQKLLCEYPTSPAGSASMLEAAGELMLDEHQHLPPAVKVEEKVTYYSYLDRYTELDLERTLAPAYLAFQTGTRQRLIPWAKRALERFPKKVKELTVTHKINQFVFNSSSFSGGGAVKHYSSSTEYSNWRDHVSFRSSKEFPYQFKLSESSLIVLPGTSGLLNATSVEWIPPLELNLPDTVPLAFEVSWKENETQKGALVRLNNSSSDPIELSVGPDPLLTLADGSRFQLRANTSTLGNVYKEIIRQFTHYTDKTVREEIAESLGINELYFDHTPYVLVGALLDKVEKDNFEGIFSIFPLLLPLFTEERLRWLLKIIASSIIAEETVLIVKKAILDDIGVVYLNCMNAEFIECLIIRAWINNEHIFLRANDFLQGSIDDSLKGINDAINKNDIGIESEKQQVVLVLNINRVSEGHINAIINSEFNCPVIIHGEYQNWSPPEGGLNTKIVPLLIDPTEEEHFESILKQGYEVLDSIRPIVDKPVVMISSTARDLPEYREQVMNACLQAGAHPSMMEHLPAEDSTAIDTSLRMVDACDVYLGIFAHRYGHIPEGHEKSITQMEYERALETGKPRLIFLIHEEVPIRLKDIDIGVKAVKLDVLKAHLAENTVIGFFKNPDDLRAQVLHSLQSHLKNNVPSTTPAVDKDPHSKARNEYLTALKTECELLPLATLGGKAGTGKNITLNEVYISLGTRTPEKESLKANPEEEKYLTALEASNQSRLVVLVGGPGSGKSTFVKELTANLAGKRLEEPTGSLPVFITLRDLAPWLGAIKEELAGLQEDKRRRKLAQVVLDQAIADLETLNALEAGELVKEAFIAGKVHLVLDGLDGVPFDLREEVRDAVHAVTICHPLEKVIVTCRIRSYEGSAVLTGFERHELAPFNEEQINGFIEGWYKAALAHQSINAGELEERTQDLKEAALEPRLRKLAENPMLMTTMALVHQEKTELPRELVKLYNEAVDILLRKWQQYRRVIPKDLQELFKDEEKVRVIMERLAFEGHSKKSQDEAADLPRGEALTLLEADEYLGSFEFARRFLDFVDERSGLLVGRGGAPGKPATYSFPHRTFQEYLAGCYLVNQRSAVRLIKPLAAEGAYWSVAVQMGAQELVHNRRNVNQLLDNAKQMKPASTDDVQSAREALWSAQMALVAGSDVVKRDSETGEPFLAQSRTHMIKVLGSKLPAIERVEAGRLLALLGDPREELLEVEKMPFCYVPKGPFIMGEDKEEHELDVPYDYWVGQSPITVAQYAAFIEAGGYGNRDWWSAAGWKWKGDKTGPEDYGEPFTLPNHPRVGVSWYEAYAFTQWLTDEARAADWLSKEGKICLPNEAEWEKAARGGLSSPENPVISPLSQIGAQDIPAMQENQNKARRYAWGHKVDPDKCNYDRTGLGSTSTRGCFSRGASPYGCQDMNGNVWEWQRNKSFPPYPYPLEDKTWDDPVGTQNRVLRGGSFYDSNDSLRCSYRGGSGPLDCGSELGFRVIALP